MNNARTFVLVLTTLAAASVGAQTIYSGSADQERRERNREEALAHYRDGTTASAREERSETLREKTREGAASVRRGTHRAAESTRHVAHETANSARRVGHKTAVKARDITARVDAKLPPKTQPSVNPDGINPQNVSTKSPTAPSNGIVK